MSKLENNVIQALTDRLSKIHGLPNVEEPPGAFRRVSNVILNKIYSRLHITGTFGSEELKYFRNDNLIVVYCFSPNYFEYVTVDYNLSDGLYKITFYFDMDYNLLGNIDQYVIDPIENTIYAYINDAGKLHRIDGPARELVNNMSKQQICKEWWIDDQLHREDGPAIEWVGRGSEWYVNGIKHRIDGPAAEWGDGGKEWWINGKKHREGGPAIEDASGTREWWINGKRHREDGPAIEYADGDKEWFVNGKRHREDGPAVERADGSKFWWVNGERHREDGPAVEWADGYKEWWIEGIEVNSDLTPIIRAGKP